MKNYMLPALVGFIVVTPCLVGQTNAPSSREQLQQFTTQLQQSPGDEALREKIINLATTMKPKPVLPEETERRMARGFAAFKEAKSASDYKDAVVEFDKATLAAPWYADAYYNLGQAQAKAEDYAGAAASLKLYLLAAPGAKDAADAKTLMYEMEYKGEKADKERSAAQASAEQLAQAQRVAETFRGTWYGAKCHVGTDVAALNRGCTVAETADKHWYDFRGPDGVFALEFEIESDGTIKMNSYSAWAGCDGYVYGVPRGPSFRHLLGSTTQGWSAASGMDQFHRWWSIDVCQLQQTCVGRRPVPSLQVCVVDENTLTKISRGQTP